MKYTYPNYQSPAQFRQYNQFLIENTDGVYLFYDNDNENKFEIFCSSSLKEEEYTVKKLTFDELNEVAENFSNFE